MTNIQIGGSGVRYELTDPWVIGSNLQPTVRDGGTEVSLWIHEIRDTEGRTVYGYEVRQDGETVVTGADIRSGCWATPDLDDTLRSLLSFANYYAEHLVYMGRGGYDDDPLDADSTALGNWYAEHGENLPLEWRYSADELGD